MAGHRFKPEKAEKLLDPKRKKLVDPNQIVSLLGIEEIDSVADLGAGNGYLTLPIAKRVTKGKVFAVDIEPKMLELLEERIKEEGLENVHSVVSDLENIHIPDQTVNKSVIAFVMHEVPNMENALNEFKRITIPGGAFLILEWQAVESEVGPPLHERIHSDEMRSFLIEKGFEVEVEELNESVYAIRVQL
ncbi:class I SAM-dependent methyltransferase [Bacillus carboniphilus]|uniref:Class I SAM-dependent methyltransferase n=1 Tax=Bacillus carboniphilus TaxID=86663 RepID=A0ABN0W9Z2_9BACI